MDKASLSLRLIRLDKVTDLHPVTKPIAREFSNLYLDSTPESVSPEAVTQLLQLHPLQLVAQDNTFLLIAGFRSYQLALAKLPLSTKIPALILKAYPDQSLAELAEADILASRLVHSLGSKPAQQLQRLIGSLDPGAVERLSPNLTSNRAIQRAMKG